MTSHAELVFSGDLRVQVAKNEGQPLVRENPGPADGWHGPDAGYLRNREALRKETEALCDRFAAAAKKKGRPLTSEEVSRIGKGEEI